jgi:hypothetical protein
LSANSRIDNFSTRLSRLICSNNSTLDLAIPTPTLDNIDAEIASRGGANIRDDTPPTHAASSPPRWGRHSRRNTAQPGPSQVITRKNVKHDRVGRTSVTDADDFKAKIIGALRRLQKMPHIVRAFFADPDLRYITA